MSDFDKAIERYEEKIEIAKRMLEKGVDISFISETTKLSEKEILNLKKIFVIFGRSHDRLFDAFCVRGGGLDMQKRAFAHRSPCTLLLNWHASRAFDICNVMQRHLGHRRCKHRLWHSICVHLARLGHARSSKLDSRVSRLLTHSASVATAQICKSELLRIVRLAHFY